MYLGSLRFGLNFVGEGKAWGSLFALDCLAIRHQYVASGEDEIDRGGRCLGLERGVELTIISMASLFDLVYSVPIFKFALAFRLQTCSLVNR